MPKENMYQSLHTTVLGPGGRPLEVQIRTREMHRTAEYGIAAHWRYKDGDARKTKDAADLAWLAQMLEWLRDAAEPSEVMEGLRIDLYADQVFVFTPKGDVVNLPGGATPVDFAYAIHTEVGNQCVGAKVNARIVPLKYALKNGDVVDILTQQGHLPSKDWLSIAKTSKARTSRRPFVDNTWLAACGSAAANLACRACGPCNASCSSSCVRTSSLPPGKTKSSNTALTNKPEPPTRSARLPRL